MYYVRIKFTGHKKLYRCKALHVERIKDTIFIESVNHKIYTINWEKVDFYTKVYYEDNL